MVKIGPVTAEIILIWTNVARTNVAWTNVTKQLESVKDVPRNLPLKFCNCGLIMIFMIDSIILMSTRTRLESSLSSLVLSPQCFGS